MDVISSLLADSMHLLYFVNGLAFFSMGLAIVLERRRSSGVKLADSLWLLCAHAFAGAFGYWLHAFSLAQGWLGDVGYPQPLYAARSLSLTVGAVLILQFGANTIAAASRRRRWVRWAPGGFAVLGLVAFLLISRLPIASGAAWWQAIEVVARVALYFPGLVLAAIGFILHGRIFSELKLRRIARDCTWAALAFGVKALVSGLVAVPTPTAAILFSGTGVLAATAGVALQLARAATTLAVAYYVVRVLRFLEVERRQQLDVATEQRLQAQQEALQAQQRAREATERWSRQLEDMVNTMAVAMSRPFDLKEMLHTALRKALDLAGFEAGSIWLLQEQGAQPALVATSGLPQTPGRCVAKMILGDGAGEALHVLGEAVILRDLAQGANQADSECRQEGFRYLVSVPVKCRGRTLGLMHLLSRSERAITAQEQAILAAIGQQIAVAIENARLHSQAQNVAALEERSRLSRELHDGLAQVLGYLRLRSEDARALLVAGRIAEATAALSDVHDVAREAYRDVRETLLDLRTTLSPDRSLSATLNEYLHRFSEQSGVKVSLVAGDQARIEFGPDAEIQVLRIIQEALTNVRKHSRAQRAWVRFGVEDGHARIIIADDGQGFDASSVAQDYMPHLGLQTMKERAQSVGGSVQVESMPGKGTEVRLRIPLADLGGDQA